jgi:hypothetical protein
VTKAEPQRVCCVGDKTPEAAIGLPVLETLYPSSKYIHVIRDGRDCVASGWAHLLRDNTAGRFATIADYAEYFAARHWTSYVTLARAAGAHRGTNYIEVRYEDLHADPAREAERLLRFLDVDASPAAIATCVASGSFERLSGGRKRGDSDSKSHFRKGVVGDFVTTLPGDAIDRFEQVAGPLLHELGYPLTAGVAR